MFEEQQQIWRAEYELKTNRKFYKGKINYILWLERKLFENEKNNAKTHVIGRSEQLLPTRCRICDTEIRYDVKDRLCPKCYSRQ